MIGRTLSHYKILSEISRGGMGIVYRAVDLKLDREVALKVLPPELVADPERKRRFIQEAKAAAKLEHPHIGVVYEIDEVDGVSFIAMELIRGEQLRDTIAKGSLPLRRALEIAIDIAEGLSKAHDEGIVHRDLKPANIMVTEDGHTKIIDFGLAKLVEALVGEGSDIETLTRGETDPGKVVGTVSYMSPEQARGQKVDHRSDIFSFGIVLHEMLSGRLPFEGKSGLDTLHAILNDAAPRLSDLGSNVTSETRFELQHIVDKCLSKAPAERYQTIPDAVIDLRSARRHLESGSISPVISLRRRKLGILAAATGAVALLIIGWLVLRPQTSPLEEVPTSGSKPSIAVLHFENASGDPDLEWLRTGLTDMLVTDLSQSPSLSVLSTERLYQILRDMKQLDERITSLDIIQEIAERANSRMVVLGSYMKSGDIIRINIRIQDASTGRILNTQRIEGSGESSIFPLVDELTRRIKASLEVPKTAEEASYDLAIEDVTTSSVEAFRYYTECVDSNLRGLREEHLALCERAVQLDPRFAAALHRLSIAHNNLGNRNQAEEYARRALDEVDRLTVPGRLLVEGWYYLLREETWHRAFEVYRKAIELDPDARGPRHNMARRLAMFERFDEAIELFEELRKLGHPFPNTHFWLALCYAQRGQYEAGLQVLQEYLANHPDNPRGYSNLGQYLIEGGNLDTEAMDTLQRSEVLSPLSPEPQTGFWTYSILQENWERAERAAKRLRELQVAAWKLQGSRCQAITSFYRGREREGMGVLEEGLRDYGEPDSRRASTLNYAAHVLLEQGQAAKSLELAERARMEGKGDFSEWEGLYFTALAQAKLGRWNGAEKIAQELRNKAEALPTQKETRRYHHLQGELALARGDTSHALEELQSAQSMLTPRALQDRARVRRPQHVPIWFSLASAHWVAGDEEKAAEWFQRIIESTTEHVEWPIPYIRSFYFLGKIHEKHGEMDEAREYYRRFYEYWKDGDMDRERVEEARKKLDS